MVRVLPSLHSRPNWTNLNKLEGYLVDKLSKTVSYQSMEDIAIYALRCATRLVARPDPGPHCRINSLNNTAGQADKLVQYNFKRGVCNSEDNLKSVVIDDLNLVILDVYKREAGGGVIQNNQQSKSNYQGTTPPSRKVEPNQKEGQGHTME